MVESTQRLERCDEGRGEIHGPRGAMRADLECCCCVFLCFFSFPCSASTPRLNERLLQNPFKVNDRKSLLMISPWTGNLLYDCDPIKLYLRHVLLVFHPRTSIWSYCSKLPHVRLSTPLSYPTYQVNGAVQSSSKMCSIKTFLSSSLIPSDS